MVLPEPMTTVVASVLQPVHRPANDALVPLQVLGEELVVNEGIQVVAVLGDIDPECRRALAKNADRVPTLVSSRPMGSARDGALWHILPL